ncbi:MAG: hypothetical protein RMK97_06685 [Sutterellaceae bacterium]|nr:hypothetical protein [Burkholderiaceae bacterium]MCX7902350.1 hypothetical protein [Burkholderiaceae bacterium]MDW8430174.1 hypothetical protein [Sutterellaceae bacterium]
MRAVDDAPEANGHYTQQAGDTGKQKHRRHRSLHAVRDEVKLSGHPIACAAS